jgi:acetyltransferase
MSAARGFARSKPIIALKVGRSQEGAQAALFHTGSLTGADQVFDAAFKRAGILRVESIAELFDCAKTLAMQRRPNGDRLAIITNAGGPGVIATDALIARQGALANVSAATRRSLAEKLPSFWKPGNPIDLLGDADPARYHAALDACLKDRNVDGILTILTPQAMTDAVAVAGELAQIAKGAYKTLLAAFMGEDDVAAARRILEQGRIPAYETPEDAVRSFLNMVAYQRNLKLLTETPATIPHAFTPHTAQNRQLIGEIAAAGRSVLTYPEVKQILANYDIPVPEGGLARSPAEARALANRLGYPVTMKVVSAQIIYESEVGGIAPEVRTPAGIAPAYRQIVSSAQEHSPLAQIAGVYVQPLIRKQHELLIGMKKDPLFGPAIVFGMGGVAVDVFKDVAIGLPPLNRALAQQLIDETRIAALLKGHRGAPAVDTAAIQFLLYKFAYLVMDFPEIKEMDLNPFAVDEQGGIVLDAKIVLDEDIAGKPARPYAHMVISPYPKEYEKTIHLKNGQPVLLRPIRPEDEPIEAEMFAAFSEDYMRFRFMGPIKDFSHELLIRYTQIDYDREIALIAELNEGGRQKMAGVVRLIADPYNETAEYAIVVADPWQRQGLGAQMTEVILEIARQRGVRTVYAYVLDDNAGMLHLFKKFGFKFRKEKEMYYVEKRLAGD